MTEFPCDIVIADTQSVTVYSNNDKGCVLQSTAFMEFQFNIIQLFWRVGPIICMYACQKKTSYLQPGKVRVLDTITSVYSYKET